MFSVHAENRNFIHHLGKSAGSLLLALLLSPATVVAEVRILVDTQNARLQVFDGNKSTVTLENIAIGRYGVTAAKRLGDGKTPLGSFRVSWIKKDERFHYFIGLDYPDREAADRGLAVGLISAGQHRQIEFALKQGKLPPQNTPLGGYIGLHGIGQGNPEVHRDFNWTRGCVAVTDQQVDVLLQWLVIGTPVEIR